MGADVIEMLFAGDGIHDCMVVVHGQCVVSYTAMQLGMSRSEAVIVLVQKLFAGAHR